MPVSARTKVADILGAGKAFVCVFCSAQDVFVLLPKAAEEGNLFARRGKGLIES